MKAGIPGSMPAFRYADYSGMNFVFDFYKDDTLVDKEAQKQWDDILDSMIFTFSEIALGLPGSAKLLEKVNYEAQEGVLVNIGEEPNKVELDAYYLKLEKGLQLFGKHFRDLWD